MQKVNPSKINWESQSSCIFFNPAHRDKKLFTAYYPLLPKLKSHIWITSSGRHIQKWIALSKKAFLLSAKVVNQHLEAHSKDIWALSLPLFHVGGLSILARSYLSQSSCHIYSKKWSATSFIQFLRYYKITLCSLVPAQVYDLVKKGYLCPPHVRAILVGGDHLSFFLYQKARQLKWPLLPSYGLTECSSQVATVSLDSLNASFTKKVLQDFPEKNLNGLRHKLINQPSIFLKILPHIKIKIIQKQIALQSKSLMSGFVPLSFNQRLVFQEFKNKWYLTGDRGKILTHKKEKFLQIKKTSTIKIKGEKVHLNILEEIWMSLVLKQNLPSLKSSSLLSVFHERDGFSLAVVLNPFTLKSLNLIKEFNRRVSPFERISQVYFLPKWPVTDTLKTKKKQMLKTLGFAENQVGLKEI